MSDTHETPKATVAQASGLAYSFRILLGCVIVWFVLDRLAHHSPLWALISVIIVTEPELSAALQAFYSRVVNTLIGCSIGILLLYLFGSAPGWVLLGITISVFVCTQWIHVPGSWRVAPVTVAIVMTPAILGGGRSASLSTAIERTEEVLLGCAVALLVTLAANWIRKTASRAVTHVNPKNV
jgi:uncharacterized membrane protein YccC